MVGFNQKPISIKLTIWLIIHIKIGRLVGLPVILLDDFVDSTSKDIVNGAISGDQVQLIRRLSASSEVLIKKHDNF